MTSAVQLLILGSGWTGTFLEPLLCSQNISYAATTRSGGPNKITWSISSDSIVDVGPLPKAKTVLITFPMPSPQVTKQLIEEYEWKHGRTQWIILSSTRPFANKERNDRNTPLDPNIGTERQACEQVVLRITHGCVLHLAGLWGDERLPSNWVKRFNTPSLLRVKLLNRPLTLVHGSDVAAAIVAVQSKSPFPTGRWIVTDGGAYDWIAIIFRYGSKEQLEEIEKLRENDEEVKKSLGNSSLEEIVSKKEVYPRLDSTEFWENIRVKPKRLFDVGWVGEMGLAATKPDKVNI